MADGPEVVIGGNAAGALAALNTVKDGVRDLGERGKAHVDSLAGGFSKLQETMIAVAAIAAGGAMFKDFVKTTLEATGQVVGLQKAFGMTLEQANSTKSALDLLGLSTQSYTEMATRLDRQIRAGSDSLKKMGLSAADLDLGQKGMMDKAIMTLAQYKEGVDRNIAAQVLFGRGGADAVKMIMLGQTDVIAKAKELEEAFGLTITEKDKTNARAYKLAMNEIEMAFDGIKKAIGDQVLPYLTRLSEWFINIAPSMIGGMKGMTESVVSWMFSAVSAIGNLVISTIEQINNLADTMSAFQSKMAAAAGGALAGGVGGFAVGGPLGALLGAFGGGALGVIGNNIAAGTDVIASENKKLDDVRKKFNDNLAAFREMIMNGPTSSPMFGAPPKGTKSAKGLIEDGGADKDAIKAAMTTAQAELQIAKQTLQQKSSLLDMEVALGRMTQDRKFALLMQYTEQTYQQELKILQGELEIGNISVSQRAQILAKMRILQAQHNTEMVNLDKQSVQAQIANWRQYTDTVASSLNGQLRSLVTGQTTFAAASKSILLDLSLKTVELLVTKPASEYIAGQLAMLTATQSGAAAKAGAEVAAQEAALPAKIASFSSDLTARAALTFAGVMANLSPLLGPGAAVPAAASEATVLAQMAAVPKFDIGAWSVPRTGLATIHAGETILPAGAPADAYRQSVMGGGKGGGDTHIHLSAMDGASMASWLKGGGGAQLAGAVAKYQDKNPSSRRKRG